MAEWRCGKDRGMHTSWKCASERRPPDQLIIDPCMCAPGVDQFNRKVLFLEGGRCSFASDDEAFQGRPNMLPKEVINQGLSGDCRMTSALDPIM
jgi:hypothetical protein